MSTRVNVKIDRTEQKAATEVNARREIHGGGNRTGQYAFRGMPIVKEDRPGYGQMPAPLIQVLSKHIQAGSVRYVMFSYSTPIAWLVSDADGIRWIIPQYKYSPTTTSHQSCAYWTAKGTDWEIAKSVE